MIACDGVSDLLENDRLSRFGRRYDDSALTESDRTHNVHDPHGVFARRSFEIEMPVRVERREIFEQRAIVCHLAREIIEQGNRMEREEAFVLSRRANGSFDRITGS